MGRNSMKILIVRTSPTRINLNTYNLQEIGLAKALIRKGHSCDVVYYCGKEKDHIQQIQFDGDRQLNILWLHGYGTAQEGIFPSLRKYAPNYDIIQVGGYVGLTSCWLNRRFPNKVVNYQGPYYCEANKGDIRKAKIWDTTLLPLSNRKNMVVATKSVLAADYIRSKGITDVTTIGVGLDPDNILADGDEGAEHEFVQQLRAGKGSGKYLLYIGVLEERRNIHFLLRVFRQVLDRMPECKLVLIGRGKQPYVDSCLALMKELGIEDRVIRRERLEQKYMKAVYETCDAFLLPTRYEIFGMVLLEAMYFGLPVFTTYNGGSSTLMTRENGIVIPELDQDVWTERICGVLEDPEVRDRIGKNAKQTIARGYTWDALVEQFLEVYQSRLDKSFGRETETEA